MEKKKPPPRDKTPRRITPPERKVSETRPPWHKDPRVEPLERR